MSHKRIYCIALLVFILLNILSIAVYAERYTDVIYRKKNSQMKIALTFDDGPHPKYTPEILDILAEYDIKATFFMVGQNVELYPGIVKRVVSEGHDIGNHTYTHCHLSNTDSSIVIQEIDLCEQSIYELCEYRTKFFRPPEGVLPETIRQYALDEDYSVILWSVDTYDWAHADISDITQNIKKNIVPGDIILMHDYVPNSITPQALKIIIPMLLEMGYQFVPVSELLGSE